MQNTSFSLRGTIVAGLALAAAAWPGAAAAWTQSVIHDFCSRRLCADGNTPFGALAVGPSGEIYGVTTGDGNETKGNVFKLAFNPAKNSWKVSTLYQFCPGGYPCSDGYLPGGGVIVDVDGNIYGTAVAGGAHGDGVVFELLRGTPGHRPTFKQLYNFCSKSSCTDGNGPSTLTYAGAASGQLYDGVSPLYGTTYYGGRTGGYHGGVVFQLTLQGGVWTESVLYAFCIDDACSDGDEPSGLTLDANGHLLGVTGSGGSGDRGTMFQLSFDGTSWTETVLHSFCLLSGCADGASPSSDLTIDAAGDVLGATYSGGKKKSGCCGTLYELAPNGDFKVLYNFCSERDCRDGANPVGTLVLDASGHIFGVTANGGGHDFEEGHQGGGTVFDFDGTSLTPIHRFCARQNCTDGWFPAGALLIDQAGDLFGMTASGGRGAAGVVFELTP
jgi:uncharacterized repeat protein (TIGR03803 family)